MLDKKYILENVDLVQKNCDNRGVKANVSLYADLEKQCRSLQQEIEEHARQANQVSKSIGKAKDDTVRYAERQAQPRSRVAVQGGRGGAPGNFPSAPELVSFPHGHLSACRKLLIETNRDYTISIPAPVRSAIGPPSSALR